LLSSEESEKFFDFLGGEVRRERFGIYFMSKNISIIISRAVLCIET